MRPVTLKLWRKDPITGYWRPAREVTEQTRDDWLRIFQEDEPTVQFQVSVRRPPYHASAPGRKTANQASG
jgi:hypothetical protein